MWAGRSCQSTGRQESFTGSILPSLMTEWQCPETPGKIERLFDRIAGRYDLTNQVLSLGLQNSWRRRLIASLEAPFFGPGLDICSGTGALLKMLRAAFGDVYGLDFSFGMLRRSLSGSENDSAVHCVRGNALSLPFPAGEFSFATAAFGVRSFSDLRRGLSEMRRVLKKGGQIRILEFGQPSSMFWLFLYRVYAAVVLPLAGGIITGDFHAYAYLKKSALIFPCGEDFKVLMSETGFVEVSAVPILGGIVFLYCGTAN